MNEDKLYARIGSLIKEVRRSRDMNQNELSEALGLSRTSITNIECGKQRLSIHTLYEIADILEVDISEFIQKNSDLMQKTIKLKELSDDENRDLRSENRLLRSRISRIQTLSRLEAE